jgi:hypothetical protein
MSCFSITKHLKRLNVLNTAMAITQVPQKEEERTIKRDISTKAPLSERIMKKVATAAFLIGLAAAPTNCTFDTNGLRVGDAGQSDADMDVDADTDHDAGPDLDADVDTDADSDLDGGPDLDADTDVDADTDLDGGPDADADTDLDGGMDADVDTDADADMDGGPDLDADTDVDADSDVDGGMDADVDTDADAGPIACASTFVDSISTTLVYVSTPVSVGGYIFSNNGESGSGIMMDISCEADAEPIESGIYIEDGSSTVIERPIDGKRITIYNIASNPTAASMTIHVENL